MCFSEGNRSKRRPLTLSLMAMALLLNAASAHADANASRVSALAWLYSHQNGDGSWGTSGQQVQATYASMSDLVFAGVLSNAGKSNGNAFNAAAAWMANASPGSVDSRATQILSLYLEPNNQDAQLFTLESARNSAKNWGSLPGFGSNVADTSLAAYVLLKSPSLNYFINETANVTAELCYVLNAQDPVSHGWPYLSSRGANTAPVTGIPQNVSTGSILPSVYAIQFIQYFINSTSAVSQDCTVTNASNVSSTVTYPLATAVSNGIGFLKTRQNSTDHGFGEYVSGGAGKSTVFDSSMVYWALGQTSSTDPVLAQIQNYLISVQNSNGSWNNDALQTAYALRAMPRTALTISANDGIPDAVKTALGLTNTSVAGINLKPGNGQSVTGYTTPVAINPAAKLGVGYLYTFGTTGTYKLISGSLPDGLVLNSSGTISGVPQVAGHFAFEYSVDNGTSSVASLDATGTLPPSSGDVPLPAWSLLLMGLALLAVSSKQMHNAFNQ